MDSTESVAMSIYPTQNLYKKTLTWEKLWVGGSVALGGFKICSNEYLELELN